MLAPLLGALERIHASHGDHNDIAADHVVPLGFVIAVGLGADAGHD